MATIARESRCRRRSPRNARLFIDRTHVCLLQLQRERTSRKCARGLVARAYIQVAHTYRSSLSIILPMWNTPPSPPRSERPTRGVATPRYRARYRRYIAALTPPIPLPPRRESPLPARENYPQDRKILGH